MRFLTFVLLSCRLFAAERWQLQYFHDKDREELRLTSIAFCSAMRGVATGVLVSGNDETPSAVVTSNAGATWTVMRTQEAGYALHFVDETSGWMLSESGIWFTDECGRSWRRVKKQRGLNSIYFVSPDRGWAVGANKTVIQTSDAGKTWVSVKEVDQLKLTSERTTFHAIAFSDGKAGILAGRSYRPQNPRLPLWLDSHPELRRERPSLSVTLETRDGGETWKAQTMSLFGRISRLQLGKNGKGLALVEFDDYFDFQSEVFLLDTASGATASTLRRKDLAITDIYAGDTAFVAGFRPSGVLRLPIPGPVRIARSSDRKTWKEDTVDYRAVASRVFLAESAGQMWAATDTGMILKLSGD